MIAYLSEIIGAAAASFATMLLTLLPFLPQSLAESPEQIMVVVGFAGQGLFAMRFICNGSPLRDRGGRLSRLAFGIFQSVAVLCFCSMLFGVRIR